MGTRLIMLHITAIDEVELTVFDQLFDQRLALGGLPPPPLHEETLVG
jgi:hypothetical protein